MRLFKSFLFLLGILASSATVQAADLPAVGTKVQNTIKVGTYSVPLPEGSWTIISSEEGKISRLDGSKGSASWNIPVHRVTLAQAQNSVLAGFINIETPISREDEKYKGSHAFEQKSAFFAENFYVPGASHGKQSLVVVDPFIFTPHTANKNVYSFMKDNNLSQQDKVFVRVGFNLGVYGSFLKIDYYFAPTTQGHTSLSEEAAKFDVWHPEKHSILEPAEKTILDGYVKWALDMQAKLLTLF